MREPPTRSGLHATRPDFCNGTLERHLELRNEGDIALMDALCDGLGEHAWCQQDPFGLTDDERLRFSWEEFSELVKHRRHYFFLREKRKDDELYSPLALLRKLATWCERFHLVRTLRPEVCYTGLGFRSRRDRGQPRPTWVRRRGRWQ